MEKLIKTNNEEIVRVWFEEMENKMLKGAKEELSKNMELEVKCYKKYNTEYLEVVDKITNKKYTIKYSPCLGSKKVWGIKGEDDKWTPGYENYMDIMKKIKQHRNI